MVGLMNPEHVLPKLLLPPCLKMKPAYTGDTLSPNIPILTPSCVRFLVTH